MKNIKLNKQTVSILNENELTSVQGGGNNNSINTNFTGVNTCCGGSTVERPGSSCAGKCVFEDAEYALVN